jgi:membrane protein DedA with SNARE-associated domain
MDVSQLIAAHGPSFYLLAFVWTFLEGETVVVFAGFAAAQGLLNPAAVLLTVWLGSFGGDQCWFWIGRHFGQRVLRRFPPWRSGADAALAWLERYNAGFILTFRFIYGVRNISSFAMGLSAIHWQRFMWLNLLAAGLWAASFIGTGYFLGHAFRAVLGDLARSVSLVMLAALAAISGTIWLLHRAQRRLLPPDINQVPAPGP